MSQEDLSLTPSKKSGWQRPENWFTWGGVLLAGFFVFKGLDVILPLLERVLENVIYTAALAAVVGVLGFLLANKDVHQLIWYGYKMAMRRVTRLFIEIDPVAILETYIGVLEEKASQIGASLAELRKQRRLLDQVLQQNRENFQQSMQLAERAKKTEGMHTELQLQARRAGRIERSTTTYENLSRQLDAHIALTTKMHEVSRFMILDIRDTVDQEKRQRATIQASYRAMAASKRILLASRDSEMYDTALESIRDDYADKLGQIDQFMEDSRSFMNSADLQNGLWEDDALKRLADWETRAPKLLEGGSGKTKFNLNDSTAEATPVAAAITPLSYDDLFTIKKP